MTLTRRQFIRNSAAISVAPLLTQMNCSKPQGPRPNIIILFSDELKLKDLSCYGGSTPTPNLDALSASGIRFTRAYTAAPMCTPSRFSLLTGKYPGRCHHPGFLKEFPKSAPYSIGWNSSIEPSVPTLASLLSAQGYTTGMAGKWHIGARHSDADVPEFNQYDNLDDPEVNAKLQQHQALMAQWVREDAGFDEAASVLWENFDTFPILALQTHQFPWINKGALDFIENHAGDEQPFFLYAATTAVHGPHHAQCLDSDIRYTLGGQTDGLEVYDLDRDALREKTVGMTSPQSMRYTGIRYLDHHVGLIMDKLTELNIADNTLIIFAADHNIEPGKASCYQKGSHIPFIMNWPKKLAQGQVNQALIQLVDVLPTLMTLADAPMPQTGIFDGFNMMPLLQGKTGSIRDTIYIESGYARSVFDGRYHYIAFRPPEEAVAAMASGQTRFAPNQLNIHKQAHGQIAATRYPHYFDQDQLYDFEADPYELTNLADDPAYADILSRLKNTLEKQLNTFSHPFSLKEIPFMQTAAYRQLADNTRALGTDYIGWLKRDHGDLKWPPEL